MMNKAAVKEAEEDKNSPAEMKARSNQASIISIEKNAVISKRQNCRRA